MIVLDTHTLLWWVSGSDQLSVTARSAIEKETRRKDGQILVSSITAWEIALLLAKGRLALATDVNEWLGTVANIEAVRFVPIDNEVAVQSVQLPGTFHPDPADRMITALARRHSVPVVTADSKIRDYPHVKTLW